MLLGLAAWTAFEGVQGLSGGGPWSLLFSIFAGILVVVLLLVANQVLRMLRSRVVVTSGRLTAFNFNGTGILHAVHSATRSEIIGFEIRSPAFMRRGGPVDVPYVNLKGGGGFYLDALMNPRRSMDFRPTQLRMVNEIERTLGLGGPGAQADT
jgi:hypothetical protein